MSALDARALALLLFAAYTALMVRHAVSGRRETRGLADYYVGGRSMGGVAVGLSFFATYSSTNSFVGYAGQAWSYGAPWLLMAPLLVGFAWIAWVAVAPRLRHFTGELDSVTIPDFIGLRFQSPAARWSAALIVVLASVPYATAVFTGIGRLLQAFLDIPYAVSIGLVLVIVMGYTAVGGFISVVRTDVVQGLVMVLASVVLFTGTVRAAGGLGAVRLTTAQPGAERLFTWDAAMPLPVLLGIMMATTMKFIVEPRQLSRFYALRDSAARRQGLVVSLLAFSFAYAMLVPIGLYARLILPPEIANSDRVVPELLAGGAVFSAPATAFLIVAMIAAAMSSLDSVLLVVASTFERDLISPWRRSPDEAASLRATRIWVAVFAVLAAAVALEPPGGIVALSSFSGSLFAACFFPAMILGLHWRRGDGTSTCLSFAVGVGTLLAWPRLPWGDALHEVFPALALSILAYAIAAQVRRSTPSPRVAALFDVAEAATG